MLANNTLQYTMQAHVNASSEFPAKCPIYRKEFERLVKGERADIQRGLEQLRAAFILLSENIERAKHTCDWIGFESGC
jgi:hypothetical protein